MLRQVGAIIFLFFAQSELFAADAPEIHRITRSFCVAFCTADTNEGQRYEYNFFNNGKQIARQIASFDKQTILEEEGVVPDGLVKEFYDSGEVNKVMSYQNNRLNGWVVTMDKNGREISRQHFIDGRIAG